MATNRIKGITIEIGGDTTKLQTALKGVNGEIKNTQSQLRDVEKLLKLDPGNTELLSQKQKLLTDAISETKEKLATLKTAAEQANESLKNGDITQEQYDALQREIVETENELQRLQTEAEKSKTALVKIGAAGDVLQNVGDKISSAGEALLPVTAGVTALGTAAVKTAADFDSAMSQVAAVSGATGDDLDALRDKAREMGSKTKFSASEAAEAMNYMAMAGWKTEDMLDGIEGIMNLAAASGEDLATTSDIVTDALTAFGLTAADSGHFADILAAASSNANTNVSMMGETFKYCAPIAGALGFSAENTAEAIGLMANAGIKSSQAGTSLRTIMNTLAGEVKIASDSLGEVVIATTNADGSMRNLDDILADCRKTFSKLSESEKASAAQTLVGKNAMSGFLALMNAGEADITKLSNAIANCNGTSESMANTMQDNLTGQLTILKSQLEELAISFGEMLMPTIREIVTWIQGLVDKFNQMDDATKQTIVKVALVAAALGPLLIVIGKITSSVGGLMKLFGNMPSILASAKTAFTTLSAGLAPILAIAAAVAVLVAAFKHLWDTNEGFRSSMTEIWDGIVAKFQAFAQSFTDKINSLGFDFQNFTEVIKAAWDKFCNYLAPIFETVFKWISDILGNALDVILGLVDVFAGVFTGDWERVWSGLKDIFSALWDAIVNTVKSAVELLCNVFGTDLQTVKEFWQGVWQSIVDFFTGIWSSFTSAFNSGMTSIQNFFTSIWTGIRDFFVGIWNAMKSVVTNVMTAIKDTVLNIWNNVKSAVGNVIGGIKDTIVNGLNAAVDFIKNLASQAFNWGADIIKGIINGIKSYISGVADAITGVADKIRAILHFSVPDEGPLTDYETWMPDFMKGLAKGIESSKGLVTNAMKGLAADMVLSPNVNGITYTQSNQPTQQTSVSSMVTAMKEAFSGANAQTGDIVIPVYLGNSMLDEIVVTAQQRMNLRSGGR